MEIEADRTCYASASSVFAASGPQGWAELPDDLVRSIITLLGYFRDLLAFVGTCCPWHDLLSAHTSSLQHLLLHPSDCTGSKRSISCDKWTLFNICEWRLVDPSADAAASCRSLLSLSDLRSMTFLHYSHGHLIFCRNKRTHIVNAFNGAKVVPPCMKAARTSSTKPSFTYADLTAPVASADSHLLVGDDTCLFQWRIGSDSWLEHCLTDSVFIPQIMAFKGKKYAPGLFGWFAVIHLSPSLIIQKFKVEFEGKISEYPQWLYLKAWLVKCGDALLLIKPGRPSITMRLSESMAFKLESLDVTNMKSRWVKVDRLENWVIFVSADSRCRAGTWRDAEGGATTYTIQV